MTTTVSADPIERDTFFINGTWQLPEHEGGVRDVMNCAEETVLARVADGSADDVAKAVEAAKGAASSWAKAAPAERADALRALRQALADRQEEIARLISLEVGTPTRISQRVQVGLPLAVLDGYVEAIDEFEWERQVGNSTVYRTAAGVVGAITPWNYPLHQLIAKVGAAVAAGCAVVAKPAGEAPLSAFMVAEAFESAGLPPGLFNVVSGPGPVVGEAIAGHRDIDVVSFTGSTEAGCRVAQLAARQITRVSLELGGKSANILLDDADLARAAKTGVGNAFLNSGQTCSAWTRMLVHRSQVDEVLEYAVEATRKLTLGHPLDPATRLGPLVSANQRESVRGYITQGIEEGARLVTGGLDLPPGIDTGYFVAPTIFADVTEDMVIANEEIFGPVLVVMAYDDDEHAVALANRSQYGLAGGVWSADEDRARTVARELRTGQVDLNGGAFNPKAPFGGYKRSGIGREFGVFGIEEFVQTQSIQS